MELYLSDIVRKRLQLREVSSRAMRSVALCAKARATPGEQARMNGILAWNAMLDRRLIRAFGGPDMKRNGLSY